MSEQELLLIEDNPGDARLLHEMLRDLGNGYHIVWVQTLAEARKEIATKLFHLILCDLGLQDSQGFDTASAVIAAASDMPVIILTGQDDKQIALEAIKTGVQDYLVKNTVTPELIGRSMRYAIERKRVEKELRSRENLLKKVFEILPIGLWIADKNGTLLKANAAGVKIWGAEPLVGQQNYGVFKARRLPSKENIAPDDWALTHSINKGLTIEGEELEIDAFDGRKKTILNYTAPVLNDNGQVEAAIVVNVDITDRKQAEEELAKLSRAVEQSPVSVVITDIEGKIEYVNPKFIQITGYALEEVKGQTPRILKSGETPLDEYRKLWETITSGLGWRGEFHNRRKDGSLFWERASISPVRNTMGTITHFLAVKEDITVEKSLEMQLLQAQKLESVGRLAGGVAHDFNNMLGIILGYAEMSLDQVEPTEPLHANLQEIRKAANRSADLTRQLLAFARKQTVTPKVLDLNETLEGMLKMLRRLIGEDIDLAWLPGKNLWQVKLDPSQIDQILANLCVNARDAVTDNGKVTIETDTLSFDENYCADHVEFVPGDYVMLAVSDNGCGMDKKILDNIFEPFFTTKDIGQGSGLGLATVYGIVKQNNGFINVYSEPGRGTTFKIYLPRHMKTEGREQTTVSAEVAATGHETILLVEDEKAILTMTSMMLELLGYTVLTASAPSQAIRISRSYSGRIDLLMTDVVMPEMNGRDLAEKLLHLFPNLKCLYMSGYTANAIAHHGVLDKGVHFIHKPFTKQSLSTKLREVLDDSKMSAQG